MEHKTKKINIDKQEAIKYLITFLISFVSVLLIYLIHFHFLNNSLTRSDSLLLFVPTIKDTVDSVISGKGIYYSFNSFLGSGNSFNLSNEFFSPFNLIFLIFHKSDVNLVYFIVLILKISSIALAFRFFTVKVLKDKGFGSLLIPVFFSNCSFVLAYGTIAFMWLDSLIALPLIAVGIYELIKNDKRILLIVAYAYLFLSQFYLGYMVGIVSFVAFVLYLFISFDYSAQNKIKVLSSKFVNYVLCVVIAAFLCAFSWVPTLFYILANRASDSSALENLNGSVFSVINGLFWGNGYSVNGFLPYIYCGLPVLLLSILFYINKKINIKEKIFFSVLIVFMIMCMSIKPLNLFMHVFDQPDMMHFRYSFIFSFVLCAMAAREISVFEKTALYKIISVTAGLGVFYFVMIFVLSHKSFASGKDVYLNGFFGLAVNLVLICLWICLGFFILCKEKKKLGFLALILAVIEIVSSSIFMVNTDTDKDEYNKWFETMQNASNELKSKDPSLYRVVSGNDYSLNSDVMFGYNGISDMGDQDNYNVRNFLSNIGFATSQRYIDDAGYNPVSNMLLGVKYIIDTPEGYYSSDVANREVNISENEYYLGLGYMVTGNLIFYEYSGRDVFENMNDIVMFMTGEEIDCFKKIPESDLELNFEGIGLENDNGKYIFTFDGNSPQGLCEIICRNDEYKDVYCQLEKEKPNLSNEDFRVIGALNKGYIYYSDYASLSNSNLMRKTEDGTNKLSVAAINGHCPERSEFNGINVYGLDEDALREQYDLLKDGVLNVTEYKNGYIKGKVKVTDGKKILFMSIPYDAGWTAYINGAEAHIVRLIDGTFMGVMFAENGEYTVEFKYECPGLKIGIWVSVLGIIAFLGVIYEKKLKNLKIK